MCVISPLADNLERTLTRELSLLQIIISLPHSNYVKVDKTHIVMNEQTYNRTRMKKDGA